MRVTRSSGLQMRQVSGTISSASTECGLSMQSMGLASVAVHSCRGNCPTGLITTGLSRLMWKLWVAEGMVMWSNDQAQQLQPTGLAFLSSTLTAAKRQQQRYPGHSMFHLNPSLLLQLPATSLSATSGRVQDAERTIVFCPGDVANPRLPKGVHRQVRLRSGLLLCRLPPLLVSV